MARQKAVSPAEIYTATLNALEDGYSTSQAIALLCKRDPLPYDALLRLVLRWDSQQEATGDTLDAVLAALPPLANMPLYSMGARCELQAHFCAVLARRPEPALIVGLARALATRGRETEVSDAQTRMTLTALLPHPDAEVRQEVANALQFLGSPLGKSMLQLLEAAWPQPKLRDKFHALLRGGTDATNVANQAMQWFTRVSKDAVDRWNAEVSGSSDTPAPASDPRCVELLRQLLNNALDALAKVADSDQTEQMRELAIACIRALVRLGAPAAQTAHSQIIRALYCVMPPLKLTSREAQKYKGSRIVDDSDDVRLAAGQALLAMYGPESFPLFVEALDAPQISVRVTGIALLGELGDVRALPLLQALAANNDLLVSPPANAAIARIRQQNPETMTLLRASSPGDARPETLLRPALGNTNATPPDILLRPAERPAPPSQPSSRV